MSRKMDKLTRRERKAFSGPPRAPASMASIITKLLIEWCERLDAQEASDYLDRDPWLGERLMGAALLLKEAACKCDELELLGLATKIEMRLSERFERETKQYEEYQQSLVDSHKYQEDRRELCRHYVAEIRSSIVNVSRYHEIIAAAGIEDKKVLAGLYKYLDEKRILKVVRAEVVSTFTYRRVGGVDPDDVRQEFDRELVNFYRRADKTVPDRIAKALRAQYHDAPAAPRLPIPEFLVPQGTTEDDQEQGYPS